MRVVREGQGKGKWMPQVCSCVELLLFAAAGGSKDAKQAPAPQVSVAAVGQALLPSCGEQDRGMAAGTQGLGRDPGRVWAGPWRCWGGLPWRPAEDHHAWLWARATQSCPGLLQDFKKPIYTALSLLLCLQQLGGNCAHAACNSWMLEPLGQALLVLQCSHVLSWTCSAGIFLFKEVLWKSSILKSQPQF